MSFRGYHRFDQWLQHLYPPPKPLLHAIVEHRPYLLWLSGGNTAILSNLTLKNKIVSHLERGTHWENIWSHFLFGEIFVLLPNYIVSKMEIIPPIGKFSKIKNNKRPLLLARSVYIK